jgi:hypothetical protein
VLELFTFYQKLRELRENMRILSVRQPWASAIFRLNKDVENRSWLTSYRGALLIHASLSFDAKYMVSREFQELMASSPARDLVHRVEKSNVTRGAIIGVVQLDDIVQNSSSTWACENNYHWLISQAREFRKPVPAKGTQGLWKIPAHLADEITRQLEGV